MSRRLLAGLATVLVATVVAGSPAAASPSLPVIGSEQVPVPAAVSAPSASGAHAEPSLGKGERPAGAGITYQQAAAVHGGPVWFHPVPGVCRGHGGGGDFHAPRSGYLHQGIDLPAGYGTPIRAVGGGYIVSAGYHGSAGNQVQERIGNTVWKYNHLSSFRRTGGWVYPGEVIGYVGATGRATGAHLHLELWVDGWNNLNPADWLWGAGVRGMYC